MDLFSTHPQSKKPLWNRWNERGISTLQKTVPETVGGLFCYFDRFMSYRRRILGRIGEERITLMIFYEAMSVIGAIYHFDHILMGSSEILFCQSLGSD
jgi:hypothetical protein